MKSTILTITAVAGLSLAAAASTPYDDVVKAVIANNPGLASRAAGAQASAMEGDVENTISGPELDFEHLWGHGTDDTRWSASVSQEFQWPGVYRARSQANGLRHQATDELIYGMTCDQALSAKLLIIDIINANSRVKLYTEIGEDLRRVADLTDRAYQLGEATILDQRKMQLAVLDSEREISLARNDLAALVASLDAMGADVDAASLADWTAYPTQALVRPSLDPQDYYQYRVGTLSAAASRREADAIKLQAIPTFSLGYVHSFEERTHFNGLSVSITLPSFSQSKRRKMAALQAQSESLQWDDELIMAMAEARGLYDSALSIKGSVEDYTRLSGDNSYLDLLKQAFDGGELTVIDYITEVNLYRRSRLDYLDLLYRYNTAVARLNRYNTPLFN